MSKYSDLRNNPPVLNICGDAREVIFTTISCMCDNMHKITFHKNSEGDFKMSGGMFSLSNWQFESDIDDIEWAADDQNWDDVIAFINASTSVIEKVKSR